MTETPASAAWSGPHDAHLQILLAAANLRRPFVLSSSRITPCAFHAACSPTAVYATCANAGAIQEPTSFSMQAGNLSALSRMSPHVNTNNVGAMESGCTARQSRRQRGAAATILDGPLSNSRLPQPFSPQLSLRLGLARDLNKGVVSDEQKPGDTQHKLTLAKHCFSAWNSFSQAPFCRSSKRAATHLPYTLACTAQMTAEKPDSASGSQNRTPQRRRTSAEHARKPLANRVVWRTA